MDTALFKLAMPDDGVRLARGTVQSGPTALLDRETSLAQLLAGSGTAFDRVLREGATEQVPDGCRVLAPIDAQEVWAAGVTYVRSRDARMAESAASATVYDRVYEAARPELFLKAPGWRVRGPGESIGIRWDSTWNVPEPELTLVLSEDGSIVAYTIGDDVSSRSIEGENPLYLPQAKTYDGSCAIGPALVSASAVSGPFDIRLSISRGGARIFGGQTSTTQLARGLPDLAAYLVRAISMPHGAFLMTGTGIVPEDTFTLAPDDVVRIEIGHLGALENRVEQVGSESRRP